MSLFKLGDLIGSVKSI